LKGCDCPATGGRSFVLKYGASTVMRRGFWIHVLGATAMSAAMIAASPYQFVQWQLVFFRSGARKNEQMQPIAEQVDNDDIRNLGAYFASLTPPKSAKPDDNPDLSSKGAQAAVGRRCASCHTDSFAGTKAVARIAGQREDYLLKALHDYKTGARSGGGMAAMADVAYPLSEEEITALAHYLAHL